MTDKKDVLSAAEKLDDIVGNLGGEVRAGQRKMVELVERSILDGTATAIQAGTGTGKSLGYLVPVIASGKKTVIVVSSIVLQDQLAQKDLPFLEEHHPDSFSYVVLKGRSNFACLAKTSETKVALTAYKQKKVSGNQASLSDDDGIDVGAASKSADLDKLDAEELSELAETIDWINKTSTGDKAELDYEPSNKVWSRVAVSANECPGAKKCDFGEECFSEQAKMDALDAQVIVVNAHLYGSDIATNKNILPEHDVLIVDEAHDFFDALVSSLSTEISRIRLMQVAGTFNKVIYKSDLPKKFAVVADSLNETLSEVYEETTKANNGSPRLKQGAHESKKLLKMLIAARGLGDQALTQLQTTRNQVAKSKQGFSTSLSRLDRALMITTAFINDIDKLLNADENTVIWAESMGDVASIRLANIDIDKMLKERVWGENMSVVLCSATLPEAIPKQLGLKSVRWVDVGSPFNYEQSILYVARHLPNPRDHSWKGAADAEIMRLLDATNGKGMVLFTSLSRMREAAEKARKRYGHDKIATQGDAPKQKLVDRMKSGEATALFATTSFWQGVDIPGLPLVILDKLPFPVPTDPVVSALKDRVRGHDKDDKMDPSFALVDLPLTAVRTAQGAGRLVRTAQDRGVVAVLDKRLADAKWREHVLKSLPPMRRVVTQDIVYDYLRRSS